MLSLLAPLGIAAPLQPPVPVYRWPTDGDAYARCWLAERGLARGRYIVLGVGARFACKQPTFEQVVRWSKRFRERWALQTVFLWTPGQADAPSYPGDDPIAERVMAARLPWLHPHRGTLPHALALIAGAATSIMPDSGLMHFAAASPGGVVGLFADPARAGAAERWAPVGPRARFLEAPNAVAELSDDAVIAELETLVTSRIAIA